MLDNTQSNIDQFEENCLLLISILVLVISLNFDFTALNMATSYIMSAFHVDLRSAQWCVSTFTLAASSFFVLGGSASDYFSKERVFIVGSLGFLMSTLMAALSSSIFMLIIAQALQGISFAFSFNSALLIVKIISKRNKIAMNISMVVAAASLTQGVAPVISSFLIHYFNWRSIFWINIPLLVFSIIAAFISMRNKAIDFGRPSERGEVAPIQMKHLFASILLPPFFIYFLEELSRKGAYNGFTHVITFLLFIAFFILILFSSRKIFKENTNFIKSIIARFIFNVCWAGVLFTIPLYLQNIKLLSSFDTGLIVLLMTVTTFFTSMIASRHVDKLSSKNGLALSFLVLFCINFYAVFFSQKVLFLIPTLIVYGMVTSFILVITTKLAMNSLTENVLGVCMGYYYSISLLGNAVGIFSAATIIDKVSYSLLPVKYISKKDLLSLYLNGSNSLSGLHFSALLPVIVKNYQISFSVLMAFYAALTFIAILVVRRVQ